MKRLLLLVRGDGSVLAVKCDPAVVAAKFGQVGGMPRWKEACPVRACPATAHLVVNGCLHLGSNAPALCRCC